MKLLKITLALAIVAGTSGCATIHDTEGKEVGHCFGLPCLWHNQVVPVAKQADKKDVAAAPVEAAAK